VVWVLFLHLRDNRESANRQPIRLSWLRGYQGDWTNRDNFHPWVFSLRQSFCLSAGSSNDGDPKGNSDAAKSLAMD
jgi:hypothetical protein